MINNIYYLKLQENRPKSIKRPRSSKSKQLIRRALISINSINGLIVLSASMERPRSIAYESDVNSISATDCELGSDLDSSFILARSEINFGISDYEDIRSRKRRKPNPKTMAYYYRCLDYSENITQLRKYGINLSKEVNEKVFYKSCVIKKLTQIKYIFYIRSGRRRIELIYSDID